MVFHRHRPLSAVYSNNYSYGTSLYEPGMNDIEKNYRTTLSKTNLRSDRGDLGLYSFAGSNLHGGAPANEKHQVPKIKGSTATTRNLYEPLGATPYGKGYYDHLRAVSPEPRRRTPKSAALMDDADLYPTGRTDYHLPSRVSYDTEYKTLPSRLSDYDSDLKRTTRKTTTTTETWVPLTTYIYHTPFSTYYYKATPYSSYTYRTADDLYSYNYVDDYKRYATTSTKTTSKNIDSMDTKITSKLDYSSYLDKYSKIQSQLEEVNRWMSDAESKIKTEVVTSRNKLQSDLAHVASIVEDTAKYNDELHSAIRKQAKQISNLSSQYEHINKTIADVLDTLDRTKARCQTLQSDLSSMQTTTETVTKRSYEYVY